MDIWGFGFVIAVVVLVLVAYLLGVERGRDLEQRDRIRRESGKRYTER